NFVRGAFVYAPDGQCLPIDGKHTKAYVISRKKFDRKLAVMAVDEGVALSLRTRAIGFERKDQKDKIERKISQTPIKLMVLTNGKHETISASVVIGADGVKSRIASYV